MNSVGNVLKRQEGLTLVEIIAVLIVMGILAAVAVPRFFEMRTRAEKKSLQIAVNDMNNRAMMAFSRSMVKNKGSAVVFEVNGFSDLGFSDTADVQAAYPDFVGIWALSSDTVITYTGANITAGVFTLTAGTATTPPAITLLVTP